jgi:hypothetical protein
MRGVADDKALGQRHLFVMDKGGPGNGDSSERTAVCAIRAVSLEREDPVELGSMQLDVGGRLQVAGHDPEQVAVVQELRGRSWTTSRTR